MTDSLSNGRSDELEQDMALARALEVLDPASTDPNYWFRFRSWVVSGAGRELARRRLMAELTIGDVVTSWARTLVPTAALAAAVAAVMLMRAGEQPGPYSFGVEELLVTEISSETVPVLLSPNAASGVVAFASDMY